MPSETERGIDRGLAYVQHIQQADGSFTITSATNSAPVPAAVDLLLHAYILDMLRRLPKAKTSTIETSLTHYLLSSLRPKGQLVAFDTIDTHALFHTLAVLYEYDTALIDPEMIAASVQFLIRHELQPGGPYRNALNSTDAPAELATNITIGRFLHHLGGPFTKLNSFVARHYGAHTHGQYYTASWPLQWQLEHTQTMYASDTIRTSTLFNEYSDIPTGSLLGAQQPDGSWPTEHFCHEPSKTIHYGAAALSTLVILNRLLQPQLKLTGQPAKSQTTAPAARILQLAFTHTDTFDPILAQDLQQVLQRVHDADKQSEIGLLALRFAPAIVGTHTPDKKALETLGVANLYNWAAYTIYDTLIDTHTSHEQLPAANVAMRTAIAFFCAAVPGESFRNLVHTTYNTIDAANAWEIKHTHCLVRAATIRVPEQLPNYGNLDNLYSRSLSHALPVIGSLVLAGHTPESANVQLVYGAFKQYLVIRQLSDDLHDWREDLHAGQLSYVVTQLLKDAHISAGPRRIEPLIRHLEQVFWQQTLPKVGNLMTEYATQARKQLQQSTAVTNLNVVDELLQGIEHMITHTLNEQQRTQAFLRAYSDTH